MPPLVHEIVLAEPRGFCAGVDRAIDIVEHALAKFGRPIYVRHEIVHNTFVVRDLKSRGAIFIESLDEVPPGATLIFSAHGVPKAVQEQAQLRGFRVFDATCPLVSKVHVEVAKLAKEGYAFIMIGHRGHPEVEGTMGQIEAGIHLVACVEDVAQLTLLPTQPIALVTQTTLSVDDAAEITAAIIARYPHVRRPKQQDICYATQNRQDAVKQLTAEVDLVVVVGSPTSSNSNRLAELATKHGIPSFMVDDVEDVQPAWFEQATTAAAAKRGDGQKSTTGLRVGLTAGASAPDVLVQAVLARIKALGAVSVRKMQGVQETVKFPLPKGLRVSAAFTT